MSSLDDSQKPEEDGDDVFIYTGYVCCNTTHTLSAGDGVNEEDLVTRLTSVQATVDASESNGYDQCAGSVDAESEKWTEVRRASR
jgi:hypothetical protein